MSNYQTNRGVHNGTEGCRMIHRQTCHKGVQTGVDGYRGVRRGEEGLRGVQNTHRGA